MHKKIMVVDDSRVIHLQMSKLLKDTGFDIVEYCRDGESAIDAYERCQPDLVTMDIILPGMDGLDTAKQLLNRWPDAKILMVSSLAYDDTIEQAEALGAKGFIYKPFSKSALIDALLKAL